MYVTMTKKNYLFSYFNEAITGNFEVDAKTLYKGRKLWPPEAVRTCKMSSTTFHAHNIELLERKIALPMFGFTLDSIYLKFQN